MKTNTFLIILRALLLSMVFVLSSQADERFRDDFPDQYVVKKGDTLWDISSTFLKSPWLWPEIWHINQQIANPHLIFPGDVVVLVYIDGKPHLTVNRTTHLVPGSRRLDQGSSQSQGSGTDRLSPKIRVSAIEEAIPAIPLDDINSWLLRNRVLEQGVIESAPYVIAGQEKRLILGVGDRLYARGQFASNIPSYGIYRKGQVYVDPNTQEILGVQAIDIGGANMRGLDGDIATMSIFRSTGDIRVGDRILTSAERTIQPTFFPSQPEQDIEGLIINVERGVNQVGMLNVIAINLGERDNLTAGNVLAIYKRGETINDPYIKNRKESIIQLPTERAGLMMVFQTFEKMSLALVLKADRGIKVGDYARKP